MIVDDKIDTMVQKPQVQRDRRSKHWVTFLGSQQALTLHRYNLK